MAKASKSGNVISIVSTKEARVDRSEALAKLAEYLLAGATQLDSGFVSPETVRRVAGDLRRYAMYVRTLG